MAPTPEENDQYSKALLRMGKLAPDAWPIQNAQMIRVDRLQSNPRNPRLNFDEKSLDELGESMLNVGVIEPLVVRHVGGKRYEIVVGERRWRAAKRMNITELPCLIRELDDVQAFELALSENIIREELSPLDEAKCYQHMLAMGMARSLREIARKLGVSHTRIQQKMNLLGLERVIQRHVATRVASPRQEKKITEGHARHILRLADPKDRRELLELIIQNNWSTRETQAYVRKKLKEQPQKPPPRKKTTSHPGQKQAPQNASPALSPQIHVQPSKGALNIRIQYDEPDALVQELENLLELARSGNLVNVTSPGPSRPDPDPGSGPAPDTRAALDEPERSSS